MSIPQDRKKALTTGRFGRLQEVHCDFLEQFYIQRYVYANTQGRLLREKPLQSLQRWVQPSMVTVRNWYIKNGRLFR
jgi:hypothetical protein